MKKLIFSECTLALLDETFQLNPMFEHETLQDWLTMPVEITPIEKQILELYQNKIKIYGHDWNEFELKQHFIGPMFALVDFSSKKFGMFAERSFSGTVEDIEMSGNPDGIIASGFRKPKQPYFCFQEYKRQTDPKGDPGGQCLAAMLVAQEMNDNRHTVYGCYIIGINWYFMTLANKQYCISNSYLVTRNDIFEVFRILKSLKQIVIDLIEKK